MDKKIMIGIPAYGGFVTAALMRSMTDLSLALQKAKIPFKLFVLANESLVQRARNWIAHEFMKSNCTHLMWIDSDIEFSSEDVLSLIKVDKPIIGANYSLKNINWQNIRTQIKANKSDWMLEHCSGDTVIVPKTSEEDQTIKSTEPFEVRYLGTGFMLVERQVFQAFQKAYPSNWAYQPRSPINPKTPKHFLYFDCENDINHIYLSEDYYFCNWAQKLGFQIFLAPWIHLRHWGSRPYQSCFFCASGAYIHEGPK